jgi:predicted RNase H-like nuclease (RuvC/YqgF family)
MKPHEVDREVARLRRDAREKAEAIRALRERVQDLERAAAAEHEGRVEKKEMYELFRACV